jgi:hypothetical protein
VAGVQPCVADGEKTAHAGQAQRMVPPFHVELDQQDTREQDFQLALVAAPTGAPQDRCGDQNTGEVIATIHAAGEFFNTPVGIVAFDTASRAMAGGDENSPADMGALVRNIDLIRAATGAHVLLVHHIGKDRERGARGHSLLKAATDTEIEVTKVGDVHLAKVTKQKDLPFLPDLVFTLEVIELGCDENDEPVTSCIVQPADRPTANDNMPARLPDAARIALEALKRAVHEGGESGASDRVPAGVRVVSMELWRKYFEAMTPVDKPDARRMAFKRASDKLVAAKVIGIWNERVWVNQ